MLSNERAEADLRMGEVRRLEYHECAAEEDSQALWAGRACAYEWTAERLTFTAGTEREEVGRDTFTARVHKLDVSGETRNGKLGVVVRALRSLKGLVAA